MFNFLQKIIKQRFFGFSLVGGGVFLLGVLLLWLQNDVLNLKTVYAHWFQTVYAWFGGQAPLDLDLTGKIITNVITTIISVESNFFLNKFLNWRERLGGFWSQWLKFHATRATTTTINQFISVFILYASFFDLQIQGRNYDYLVAAVITTALGMVFNYLGNDKFVFHEKKVVEKLAISKSPTSRITMTKTKSLFARSNLALKKLPSIGVIIPVGGNRTGKIEQLRNCVNSLCQQDYQGEIKIGLVIDQTNEEIKQTQFPPNVTLFFYQRPPQKQGRDTSDRLVTGWDAIGTDLLSNTGVEMTWPQDLIRRTVAIMQEQQVEAIDGVSEHHPANRSFLAEFQDKALIAEFPKYRQSFLLTKENWGVEKRLPCFTSFFMTKELYQRVRRYLPIHSEHGWDDYNTAQALTEQAGEAIYCSNELVSYRNHKVSLRLSKQFTAGSSSMFFYRNFPQNKFAQKRLQQSFLVVFGLIYGLLFTITGFLLAGVDFLHIILALGSIGLFVVGCLNCFLARSVRAFFFPMFNFIQILSYAAGSVYTVLTNFQPDTHLMKYLHSIR